MKVNSLIDIKKLIKNLVEKYSNKTPEIYKDDIVSAALLGVVLAFRTHDITKGTFKDHLMRNVKSQILTEVRRIYRWCNDIPFSNLPNECTEEGEESITFEEAITHTLWGDIPDDPLAYTLYKEQLDAIFGAIHLITPELTKREWRVLHSNILAAKPTSYRDLAKEFKCSHTAIRRDADRVKAMIKEKMKWILE